VGVVGRVGGSGIDLAHLLGAIVLRLSHEMDGLVSILVQVHLHLALRRCLFFFVPLLLLYWLERAQLLSDIEVLFFFNVAIWLIMRWAFAENSRVVNVHPQKLGANLGLGELENLLDVFVYHREGQPVATLFLGFNV